MCECWSIVSRNEPKMVFLTITPYPKAKRLWIFVRLCCWWFSVLAFPSPSMILCDRTLLQAFPNLLQCSLQLRDCLFCINFHFLGKREWKCYNQKGSYCICQPLECPLGSLLCICTSKYFKEKHCRQLATHLFTVLLYSFLPSLVGDHCPKASKVHGFMRTESAPCNRMCTIFT